MPLTKPRQEEQGDHKGKEEQWSDAASMAAGQDAVNPPVESANAVADFRRAEQCLHGQKPKRPNSRVKTAAAF